MSQDPDSTRSQTSETSGAEPTRTSGADDRSWEPGALLPDPAQPRAFGPDDRQHGGAVSQPASPAPTPDDPGEVVRMAHVDFDEETRRDGGATETKRS
jgi:hypothetical protein